MNYTGFFASSFLFTSIVAGTHAAETVVVEISDREATETASVIEASVPVAAVKGLEASLWASETLMNDPVGINIDDEGNAWLSVTLRRKSSMFDIRQHTQWIPQSWNWTTVEERKEFLRRELSPEFSSANEWLGDMNKDGTRDWRDLLVEDDEIYRISDRSGDGLADKSERFTWIPSSEETDIAGTVMEFDGDVFVGLPPDMWRVSDEDGDGVFETKVSISYGYAIHIGFGGHGMSGLKVGPDGKIYWGIGDIGFNGVDQDGKRWYYPRQGVLVRSEPDGSDFEVYAAGLRNVHEFDWDDYGNLIGVDNDGDHAGEEERIVYLINGSDTGWRNNWQVGKYTDPKNNDYKVWMNEWYYEPRSEDQAAHILPTIRNYHTGPAGFVYNPGTALSEKWKGHFFGASFTGNAANSAIYAFTLKPKGASFELASDQKVMSGITSVGIDFGPDGALYMADWVEGWDTDGIGRIWKLDSPENAGSARRLKTKEALARDFSEVSAKELSGLLADEDRRVRQKAQFELAKRGDAKTLLKAARKNGNQLARIHGIWGVAQIGRRDASVVKPLLELLKDEDVEIRVQAAKMLGDLRYEAAIGDLVDLLRRDGNLRIRLMATEALGRIGDVSAFDAIVGMLVENDDEDVYLRHAGAIALARLDDGKRLTELVEHGSRAVRIAAVVALKRLEHVGVAEFLKDEDEFVVTNAARAINDDEHIADVIPVLAALLGQTGFSYEPLVRRMINANLYSGSTADAQRLVDYAINVNSKENMRIESIDTLANWADASIYDRVSGQIRPQPQNALADAQSALGKVAGVLLFDATSGVRVAAVKAVQSLGLSEASSSLLALLKTDETVEVRVAALGALAALDYSGLADAVSLALQEGEEAVRRAALGIISELEFEAAVKVSLFETALMSDDMRDQQTALTGLGDMDSELANGVLLREFEQLEAGELSPAVHLDLLNAMQATGDSKLGSLLKGYEQKASEFGLAAQFGAALLGGDAERGRDVMYNAPAAQCIRCHAIDGQGGDVGPELAGIGSRLSRGAILQSLVDPSAKISVGYGLADVPSSMPPMGLLLSKSELRDVVAYLAELK